MIKYKEIEFETVDQLIEYQTKVEGLTQKAPRIRRKDMEEIIERIEKVVRRPSPSLTFPETTIPSPWTTTPGNPFDLQYVGPTAQINLTDVTQPADNFVGFNMPVEVDESLAENEFLIRAEA